MAFDLPSQLLHGESISWQQQLSLLIVILALPVLYYLTTSLRSSSISSPKTPPGSLGLPFLGETLDFLSAFNKPLGVYEFLIPRYKKHGHVFKTNIFGAISVFVTGKETANFVFVNENKLFNAASTKSFRDVIGNDSLFLATGDLHKRMRRVMGDPLSMDALKRHLNGIEDVALNVLNKWKDRKELRVLDETIDYAFQIISYILISSKPGPEQDQMKQHFHKITQALLSLPLNVPGFSYYEGLKAKRNMCQMLDKIIKNRREKSSYENDFLQSVLEKDTHDDIKFSDSQLKDNLIGILFAGHETSATGLMWAMKFIEENPSVKDNLIREHCAIQSRKCLDSYLTWEEVNNMPYTSKFINETLRMANVGRMLSRITLQDVEVDGYLVKKGWTIILDTQPPHLDATHFFEPDQFNPSRFDEPPKPHTFAVFGGGVRICLGMNLARIEMAIFLHHLITKYRWKPMSKDCTIAPTLIPKLKNGYPICVEPHAFMIHKKA